MTVEKALENIQNALRSINATADVHDALRKCMEVVMTELLKVPSKVE